MNAYFRNAISTIEKSLDSLDSEQFSGLLHQCADCIRGGGQIVASGLGKNTPICEKFVGTLNSLCIPASFLHTNSAMHGDLGVVRSKDLLLLLSKSGNTDESVALAEYLLERGVNVWLLSFEENSRLAEMIDSKIILKLEAEGDKWNIVPNNSTSVYLILLQGIALGLADMLGVSLSTFQSNHPGGSIGEILRSNPLQSNRRVQSEPLEQRFLAMSPLDKTWILDLDGTIVKHNGHLHGEDTLLDGVEDFFKQLSSSDKVIILTSRAAEFKDRTVDFLKRNQIPYDEIIFDVPVGERVLINDKKPSGLKTAYAINKPRDESLCINFTIDENI